MENELGNYLKLQRERLGLSFREVETKLNEKGIKYTYSNVKRLEDGENIKAPIKVISTLAEIYNVDKINLLNLAGANISEEVEMNSFLNKGALLFNNENISEEDKKKILDVFQEMFFMSKMKK